MALSTAPRSGRAGRPRRAGIIRDVLGGESPIIFSREIYITAALLGSLTYVGLIGISVPRDMAYVSGIFACLALRAAAINYRWSLPQFGG